MSADRAMATKAALSTLPTLVPVLDTPWLVIPPIALRRIGRLGPNTPSSRLAEFRPKVHPSILDAVRPRRGRTSPQNRLARRKILSVADCETCTRLSSECRHAASGNRHTFRQRIVKYLILLVGFSSLLRYPQNRWTSLWKRSVEWILDQGHFAVYRIA